MSLVHLVQSPCFYFCTIFVSEQKKDDDDDVQKKPEEFATVRNVFTTGDKPKDWYLV